MKCLEIITFVHVVVDSFESVFILMFLLNEIKVFSLTSFKFDISPNGLT